MYNPIRDGCRGGRDLFKWDDVRLMPYKERECYLGASIKLGYLDRGGKWRRKDWWQSYDPSSEKEMKQEAAKVRDKELESYMTRLGMIKGKPEGEPAPRSEKEKLSAAEIQDALRKQYDEPDPLSKADRITGLGFVKYGTVIHHAHGRKLANYGTKSFDEQSCDPTLNKLEGIGMDSGKPTAAEKVKKAPAKVEAKSEDRPRSRSRERRNPEPKKHTHHKHHHHSKHDKQ